ncbi:MAG: 2-oxoacid:ferredoxin oxidoreductase subunit beta [Pseudomonadota bacterium]
MSYIGKPKVAHPKLPRNRHGLTYRDYEGVVSTLCAGCGHDSVTAAIVQALFELEVAPHGLAKMSGIGCSSKTPAYFLSASHGFNSVHGRMPSVTTGANAAHRDMTYIGISGDGDSLSIGMGQFAHAVRRNLNMAYLIENNGVYGLTKGQFSASADIGSKAKKGQANVQPPIDPVSVAMTLGATFVARSFSGDKRQLVPLLKAALTHHGFALLDIISPCVTFNDHEGSTKSYAWSREHVQEVTHADYIAPAQEIEVDYDAGEPIEVAMHDGSQIVLRKVDEDYDPSDRAAALEYVQRHNLNGEVLTGLLYIDESKGDMHDLAGTCKTPLRDLDYDVLNPGSAALKSLQSVWR